jgi:thymidylate synthase (FAD)
MDSWRQWIRHRTANVNEYSTRYSIAIDAAQRTAPGEWRQQSTANRQGSGDFLPLDVGTQLSRVEEQLHTTAAAAYKGRLDAGVAREQARKDLPLSTYTEAYWKIDLHNLLHFLHLRMDDHAQSEIRSYARVIGEAIVAAWVPLVWEAFLDYTRRGMQLSRIEADILRTLLSEGAQQATAIAVSAGLLKRNADGTIAQNRERREIEAKLQWLGATVPWST